MDDVLLSWYAGLTAEACSLRTVSSRLSSRRGSADNGLTTVLGVLTHVEGRIMKQVNSALVDSYTSDTSYRAFYPTVIARGGSLMPPLIGKRSSWSGGHMKRAQVGSKTPPGAHISTSWGIVPQLSATPPTPSTLPPPKAATTHECAVHGYEQAV